VAVSAAEEQARLLPVIEEWPRKARDFGRHLSRQERPRLAIDAGAHIVNDVWGLQREPTSPGLRPTAGQGCVMHTGRGRDRKPDVIDDQFFFLRCSLEIAKAAGVLDQNWCSTPGFGFAKRRPRTIST